MCTLLKLLAGVLVLVDCAKDGNDFLLCRERYGTGNLSIGSLCGLYDLLRRLVDEVVVIALKSDSDFSLCCLRLLNNWRALLFSFNASGCFIVSLLKNRKTIFPGLLKADAITAASSEGARETHPVRQSDLFRPVLKSDILRGNSLPQVTSSGSHLPHQRDKNRPSIYGYFSQNADKIEGFRKKKFFVFFAATEKVLNVSSG